MSQRVNLLRLSDKELSYQRKSFYESQRLNGVACTINPVIKSHEDSHDFYGDVNPETAYNVGVATYVTFDTNPSVQTLKSLGWYVDNDSMPILAYIPVYYEDGLKVSQYTPSVDDKISLPVNSTLTGDVLHDVESFLVKKLVGQGYPDVIYYVVNLVPMRTDTIAKG